MNRIIIIDAIITRNYVYNLLIIDYLIVFLLFNSFILLNYIKLHYIKIILTVTEAKDDSCEFFFSNIKISMQKCWFYFIY